jgi:hypothetical protein
MNKYTDTIYFEGNQLIYKGIKMNITRETIQDYKLWTGNGNVHVMEWLEDIYLSNIVEVRDSKIDTILDTTEC